MIEDIKKPEPKEPVDRPAPAVNPPSEDDDGTSS